MKNRIISLTSFFEQKSNRHFNDSYHYCHNLYNSESLLIKFYIYRHLYFANNMADFEKNKIILDLGCADGPFLPTLNYYGNRIIGVDLLFDWLQRARELINYKKYPLKNVILLNAEGHYLPFKNNCIDMIYCLETFEHIPNSVNLINEIFRILKRNGILIYSLPIEIGISLLIRQLIGKITKFEREHYSLRELVRNGLLKKPLKRINNPTTHRNFDWRLIHKMIIKRFKKIDLKFSPLPLLKRLNPTVIVKVKKKID